MTTACDVQKLLTCNSWSLEQANLSACWVQGIEGDAKRPLEGGVEAPAAKKPDTKPAQPAKAAKEKEAQSEDEGDSESEEESDSDDESEEDSDEVSSQPMSAGGQQSVWSTCKQRLLTHKNKFGRLIPRYLICTGFMKPLVIIRLASLHIPHLDLSMSRRCLVCHFSD